MLRLIAPDWSTFSGTKNACLPGSKATFPACKGGTKMDDFVKDILLAVTVTAVAALLASLVQWTKM